jgi:hypothetical protein
MPNIMRDVLLERQFEMLDSHRSRGTVRLYLGKPYLASESNSSLQWRCPYQIVGIGSEKIKEARGMDALDAIQVSLRIAEALLNSYSSTSKCKLTWLGEANLRLAQSSDVEIHDQDKSLSDAVDGVFKKAFDEFFRKWDSRDK